MARLGNILSISSYSEVSTYQTRLEALAPGAVHETIRVKSAAWDDSGVLVYTTLNHIKYCLPNGDSGIIRTLEVPVYITKVFGNLIFCLDRDGKNRQIQVRPQLKLIFPRERHSGFWVEGVGFLWFGRY